jgi:hypothetical protein
MLPASTDVVISLPKARAPSLPEVWSARSDRCPVEERAPLSLWPAVPRAPRTVLPAAQAARPRSPPPPALPAPLLAHPVFIFFSQN